MFRHRMIEATLRSGRRLVTASMEGAQKLVDELAALKRESDATAKKLVNATRWLAVGTIILAIATIALVLVEKYKL